MIAEGKLEAARPALEEAERALQVRKNQGFGRNKINLSYMDYNFQKYCLLNRADFCNFLKVLLVFSTFSNTKYFTSGRLDTCPQNIVNDIFCLLCDIYTNMR